MASYFPLTLDTIGPAGVAVEIDAGAAFTTDLDVSAAITSTDGDLTGYQVKIWGDVDDAFAPGQYRAAEVDAPWISLASPHAVRLSAGDGSKTINARMRDAAGNESVVASDQITLDTEVPVVNVLTGPTPDTVSEVDGFDESDFSWEADSDYSAYKVKVVPSTDSLENAGTEIGIANGSVNMSGGAGSAATPVSSTINGSDLKAASAGDGDKIIKVFVQDSITGNWSVS